MEDILVPIFICVVLPVAIVGIVFATTINSDNKRAQVLIKAIESNNSFDTDKLAEALQKPKRTPRELLNLRLLRGCIFTFLGIALCITDIISHCISEEFDMLLSILGAALIAIGISYLVVYFVTRKQVKE